MGENQTAFLEKVSRLESLVVALTEEMQLDRQKIQSLIQEKKTLEEKVSATKWAHILTKGEATRATHKLEKALQEIEDLNPT